MVTERGDGYLLSGIQMDMDCAKTVDNKSIGQEAVKDTNCENFKNVWENSNC